MVFAAAAFHNGPVTRSARDNGSFRQLYPPIDARKEGFLDVGSGHELYYEESGNPTGKPVVFLHGGPGGGTTPAMRRFFDPERYRIVLFDQRGAGRSRPHACLDANTTWDLVDDIERLREHLDVPRWQVFGGSWGSTLALAYAQTHPDRVTELVLRGIFTVQAREFDWLYRFGTNQLFPEAWERFVGLIPPGERDDLLFAYHRRLVDEDESTRRKAAVEWSLFEGSTSQLEPSRDVMDAFSEDRMALALARIEVHYFVNRCFMDDGQLLNDMDRIRHIPGVIVHGRYDALCPARNAWDLKAAWPKAELFITPAAGHSAFEPANIHELVRATDRYAGQ